MKLIDAATTRNAGDKWLEQVPDRTCVLEVILQDVCAADETDAITIIAGDGLKSGYEIRPIGIIAKLEQSAFCRQDDDVTWLNGATKDASELAISTALVVEPLPVQGKMPVWIGAPGTRAVTYTGTTVSAFVRAVVQARTVWHNNVAAEGKGPLLHLSPSAAPQLVAAGLLNVQGPGEVITVWGDDVVLSPGYDKIAPAAFWTGPIKLQISPVEDSDAWEQTKNTQVLRTNLLAMVDLPPCSIVRVMSTTADFGTGTVVAANIPMLTAG